jgi:hypothetical protein
MPSLDGALNVVISLVVVIILLSLVVQSAQQFVKKLLKLKSKTIQSSLSDLLDTMVKPIPDAAAAAPGPAAGGPAPAAGGKGSQPAPARSELAGTVVDELKKLGRKTLFKNAMLDSIAKDDVLKVLTKIGASRLYPAFAARFQQVRDGLEKVVALLVDLQTRVAAGSASAKLGALQQLLAPLQHDLAALTEGQAIKATAVLGDLINLRQVKVQEVFGLLGEVQDLVKQDLAAASAAGRDTTVLAGIAKDLGDASTQLTALGKRIEDAVAPLSAKLKEVDLWYDTVMQGFDERYTRHMKSVGVVITIVTVLALNANFFILYRGLAGDPTLQAAAVKLGSKLVSDQEKATRQPDASPPAPGGALPGTSAPPAGGSSLADVQASAEQLRQEAARVGALGLKPLTAGDFLQFWRDEYPRSQAAWTPWLGHGLRILLGWLITILLVSAGAPFWEDVLESLFGLKGLVRQKTGTRNVETGEGGQPKP